MATIDGLSMDGCDAHALMGAAPDADAQGAALASLDHVLSQVAVAVVACDAAGRIVLAAGGEVGHLGFGGGDIIGQQAREVWRDAPPVVTGLRDALGGAAARVAIAVGPRTFDLALTPCWSGGMVAGVVGVAHDVTARVDTERDLRHRATHDALTRLPNRALYADRLDQALRAAARAGNRMSIMLLDLDGFKAINDTRGHAAGDAVLTEVATRLARAVRASDTVARWGGDEYALVLPGTDSEGAKRLMGHIRVSLGAVPVGDGVEVPVGISGGVAMWPDHGLDARSLLGHADAALYDAKRTQRQPAGMPSVRAEVRRG